MNASSKALPPAHIVWGALALVAALVALGGGSVTPALAQSGIRILVNDEPITSYDIKARTQMLRVFSHGKQGEKEATEQLVDEHLMMQEAKRRNITVSEAEVDAEFADRASQTHMNAQQFSQAISQVGIDPRTFKDFLRANLAWGQIVRAKFRATVTVSEGEVATALGKRETKEEEKKASFEYMLQQILFIVPENAAAGAEAKRRSEAVAFRGQFKGCDQSVQQASSNPNVVVKPPVRRDESQVSDEMQKALATMSVGGITEPTRVKEGIQIVAVCAKKEVPGRTQATEEVRSELTSERGKMLARRYLMDLKADAVIDYR
jgi:peptidyl-prolyl cis-trans isomerase SurA